MASHQTQILLVEDDADVADLVRILLEEEGHDVSTAVDGASALGQFSSSNVSLVMLDVKLPVLDGWDVCRRIRAMSPVPILMVTACAFPADRQRGLEAGASDYLCKPFGGQELVARVRRLLEREPGGVLHADPPAVLAAAPLSHTFLTPT